MSSSSETERQIESRFRFPTSGRPYIRKTIRGRVVYRRKRHLFNWRAAFRITHDIPAVTTRPAAGWASPPVLNEFLTLLVLLQKCTETILAAGADIVETMDYLPGRGPLTRLLLFIFQMLRIPDVEGPPAPEIEYWVDPSEASGLVVQSEGIAQASLEGGSYA